MVKNSGKEKYVYTGHGITFDSGGSWNFDNSTARDVMKKFSINLTKWNTKFCLSLHYNDDKSHLFANGKETTEFKADNNNVNFPTRFCLGGVSDGFSATESKEVSLNGNVYDFSVEYNSIDKSDILNIHKYLITKNNLKKYSACLLYYWVLVAR